MKIKQLVERMDYTLLSGDLETEITTRICDDVS
jgi:signal recognition particle GTPase